MGASQYSASPCCNRSAFHQIVHRLNRGTVATCDGPSGSVDSGFLASGQVDQSASAAYVKTSATPVVARPHKTPRLADVRRVVVPATNRPPSDRRKSKHRESNPLPNSEAAP